MAEETLELETETKTEVTSEEAKKEEVTESKENQEELEKKAEESETEVEDKQEAEDLEDDEEIEWHEKPATVGSVTDDKSEPKDQANVDASQLAALQKENEAMKAELSRLKADPLVSTYAAYLVSSENPNLPEFLKQVGAISYDVTQGLTGEDLVRKRYEQDAINAGLSGEDLKYAVEEELQTYHNATTLNKKRLEAEAKNILQGSKGAKTVEDLQKEFLKKREESFNSDNEWLTKNYNNTVDFLNKVIAKGKWNGRSVDSKWGERIISALGKAQDIFDPMFVRYTEKKEGERSNLFPADVIDYLDFALHRNEFKKLSKKRRDNAVASTLEEKAKAAHEANITAEKTSQKKEAADMQYFYSFEKERGKMHPDDPRNKKS